jgi:hypothetical protein
VGRVFCEVVAVLEVADGIPAGHIRQLRGSMTRLVSVQPECEVAGNLGGSDPSVA